MSRYGVTEEDIEREAEQDDRNYARTKDVVKEGCLGCLPTGFPAVAGVLLLPLWLI